MVLFTSWSDDVMAVIKPNEWLSGPEIHRRVVNRRIEQIGFGPVTWLVSLVSTNLAKVVYSATTIDRTTWCLCLLAHTNDLYVRETSEPTANVVTVVEAPFFEYCLGAGGTSKKTKTSNTPATELDQSLSFA